MIFGGNVKIGVLGGIGPEATGEFYLKLVRGLQRTGLIEDNRDYPQIFINSIPAPELIGNTISSEQLHPYTTGLRELEKFGVDAIVMVCNTIHLYHSEFQAGIRIPIIDLRQKVKEKMLRERVKTATVLGTPSTIRQGLYKFEGVEYINPTDQDIDVLSTAIFRYNKVEDKTKQKQIVEGVARKYLAKGADTILLACTEPEVMLEDVDIPKISTLDVLVEAVIDFYREQKPIAKRRLVEKERFPKYDPINLLLEIATNKDFREARNSNIAGCFENPIFFDEDL